MIFLFDANLSHRLAAALAAELPGAVHVADLGLMSADDATIADWAVANGAVVVTRDSDFNDMAFTRGKPRKVVWLRLGNSTTEVLLLALRRHAAEIRRFAGSEDAVVLSIVGGD